MPTSCTSMLSLEKPEALLRIKCFNKSFLNSWVQRKKLPSLRRLTRLQKATLPPPCCAVFKQVPNTALKEPSHTAFQVAVLMALFALHATILGTSPKIVELKRDVNVQLFCLFCLFLFCFVFLPILQFLFSFLTSLKPLAILPQSFGVIGRERLTAGPGHYLLSYLWCQASIMPMLPRSRSGTQNISSQQTFRITYQTGSLSWQGTPRLRNCLYR